MFHKARVKTCYVPGCLGSNRTDPDLAFFHFPKVVERARQWAENVGVPYTEHTVRMLFNRVVCSQHFSEADFKTKEKKSLNFFAVPSLHGSVRNTHSTPQTNNPSFLEQILSENEPRPTQLSPEKDLVFQQPSKTYERKSVGLRPFCNQGDLRTSAPVNHFEVLGQNAVCAVSSPVDVKEEKEDSIEVGQEIYNCLLLGAGGEPDAPGMDALDIVKEEVHIVEEFERQQEEEPLQDQQSPQFILSHLCRVCALETEDLVAVFGEEGTKLQLADKINLHLPIEVKRDDRLPLAVCTSCVSKLNSCHELATSCLEANEKLQELFNVTDYNMNKGCNIATTLEFSLKCHTLPSRQLSKDMEVLNKTKEEPLRRESQIVLNNDQQSNFIVDDSELTRMQPFGDEQYGENENTVVNNLQVEEKNFTKDFEESDPCELLHTSVDSGAYNRIQRHLKKRTVEDCNNVLKSKMAGVIQNIIRREDEGVENEERKCSAHHGEWNCEICGHAFSRKTALIIHQQRKHKPQNFLCSYCDKSFLNAKAMWIHERSHTKGTAEKSEPTTYVCEFCGKLLQGKKPLKEHHLANHSDLKIYKCDKCDRNYSSLSWLAIHKATHSKETLFLCDVCGKVFKCMKNLRGHKRSHRDYSVKNPEVCNVCGKCFRSKFYLNEHMNEHSGRRPYACNVCGKHFHKKNLLRQHSLVHSGVQPFKCHLCGVRFNRRGNMTQHLKYHDKKYKYTCRICDEGFATLGAALSHRRKHTKEEVENSFKQKAVDDLEQVSYKCEVCGKLFAKKESLTIHRRSHTGEKPLFECGLCGKRLSHKSSLPHHMRSFHTGERPHTCQYCGKNFVSRLTCLVHERIHTGETPYICSVCGASFRCSSNLNQHCRIHFEGKHPCPHCEKRFRRKSALDMHIRTHTVACKLIRTS
ncbi:zinc finger protein 420-like isoform X3 [Periplaneta americana]|uniref:zinc finger protein 420-like isoform X3 n=1 Tax=Periplaneta americana TaxID=6978 RepID=UPI0037E8D048